jgi:hypothetical protein
MESHSFHPTTFPFTYSEVRLAFAQVLSDLDAVAEADNLWEAFAEAGRLAGANAPESELTYLPEVVPDDMVFALLANLSSELRDRVHRHLAHRWQSGRPRGSEAESIRNRLAWEQLLEETRILVGRAGQDRADV